MVRFKIDPRLYGSTTAHRAGLPALGLWAMAGSWAVSTGSRSGFVPEVTVRRLWGRAALRHADRLVEAGLWERIEQPCSGWRFVGWIPDGRNWGGVRL